MKHKIKNLSEDKRQLIFMNIAMIILIIPVHFAIFFYYDKHIFEIYFPVICLLNLYLLLFKYVLMPIADFFEL